MKFFAVVIFSAILLCAMVSDSFFSGYRTTALFPEMALGLWFLAVCLAFSAPLFDFFSQGDFMVRSIAFLIAIVSFAMNMINGIGTINNKQTTTEQNYQLRSDIQKTLDKDYNDKKLEWCLAQPSSVCKQKEMRAEKKALQEELKHLNSYRSPTVDPTIQWASWAILAGMSLLPFISLVSARILSFYVVPAGSRGSYPRNSEPKLTEPETMPEPAPEPKPKKKGTRKRSYIPSDDEHKRLKKAYNAMMQNGEKITNEALGKAATVGKGTAGWWRKNTDLETIAGTDIVPVGEVVRLKS